MTITNPKKIIIKKMRLLELIIERGEQRYIRNTLDFRSIKSTLRKGYLQG